MECGVDDGARRRPGHGNLLAQRDLRSRLEIDGLPGGNAFAIDVDAVGGVEILDPLVLALADEAAMMAGDGGLGRDEVAVLRSTDDPGLDRGLNWFLWIGWHRDVSGTGNTIARAWRRKATIILVNLCEILDGMRVCR